MFLRIEAKGLQHGDVVSWHGVERQVHWELHLGQLPREVRHSRLGKDSSNEYEVNLSEHVPDH